MPDHWRIDEGTRFPKPKAVLLFIGVGRTTEERWRDRTLGPPSINRGELRDGVTHINVVVSTGFCHRVAYELIRDCPPFTSFENLIGRRIVSLDNRGVLHDIPSFGSEIASIYASGFVRAVFHIPLAVVRGLIVGSIPVFVVVRCSSDRWCDVRVWFQHPLHVAIYVLMFGVDDDVYEE